MVVRLRSLFSLGSLALLIACDQQADAPPTTIEEIAILPGTESTKNFGDYEVHFNALVTEQLTPEIARQYGIVRSESRIMLNVSMLKKSDVGMSTAVPGGVAASAINLTGQLSNIAMREILEGEAIYYIGELPITDGETLIFTIDATPLNEPSRFTVRFKKQFFVD